MNATAKLHQAAVILKSLPKRQAAAILARLKAADIKQVLDAVNELDQITGEQISESLELLNQESKRWKSTPASERDLENLQQETRSYIANQKPDRRNPATDRKHPFGFMITALPMLRDQLLDHEHPRNVAIVLSTLPPDIASNCMKSLDPAIRVSVLKRMCELDELNKEEVNELSYVLKLRYRKLNSRQSRSDLGLNAASGMLSCSDPETQITMLEMMGQTDPELAETLEQAVVTINHLPMLSAEDVKTLLQHVDTSCWAPALKKAPLNVQQIVFRNMNPKPAEFLGREMSQLGDIDPNIEQLARRQIINGLLNLQSDGSIRPFKKRTF